MIQSSFTCHKCLVCSYNYQSCNVCEAEKNTLIYTKNHGK